VVLGLAIQIATWAQAEQAAAGPSGGEEEGEEGGAEVPRPGMRALQDEVLQWEPVVEVVADSWRPLQSALSHITSSIRARP
jgi:hypothetical protein